MQSYALRAARSGAICHAFKEIKGEITLSIHWSVSKVLTEKFETLMHLFFNS